MAGASVQPLGQRLNISHIQIDEPPEERPLWLTVLWLFVVTSLTYYLQKLFLIWFLNRSLISWWQKGAKLKKYNRYMSIWLVLSDREGALGLSFLLKTFYSPNTTLSTSQMTFMREKLFPLRRFVDPVSKEQLGLLTPDHLCDSILLHEDDQDDAFDAWLKIATPPRKVSKRCSDAACLPSNDYDLTFNSFDDVPIGDKTYQDFTGKARPLKAAPSSSVNTDVFGVYPGRKASSFEDWKGCIQAWANGGLSSTRTSNGSYYMWGQSGDMLALQDVNNLNDPSAWDSKAWWDVKKQPDNILARSGIHFLSPLVTAFVNQKAFIDKVEYPLDADAFVALLGGRRAGNLAGGWVGLLQVVGETKAPDDVMRMCFLSVDLQSSSSPNGPPCRSTLNIIGSTTGSAVSGFLATYMTYPSALKAGEVLTTKQSLLRLGPVGIVAAACLSMTGLSVSSAISSCKT